jgi:hypothetical protein
MVGRAVGVIFGSEYPDLRDPGSHQGLGLVLSLLGLGAIALFVWVVVKAVDGEGRRRAAWLVLAAAVALLVIAPIPLVQPVTLANTASCGHPLLQRDDLRRAVEASPSNVPVRLCIAELARHRRRGVLILLSAGVLGAVSVGLFVASRRSRAPSSQIA